MAAPQVYISEQDPVLRELLREVLEDEGYQVSVDDPDAPILERVRAVVPALLLLEVHGCCPERWWTLWDQLRRDPLTRTIPVVLTTTNARWRTQHEAALATLGIAVLPKPFELTALVDTLAGRLRARAPGRQPAVVG
jgi:CheY-like chemotaxis protein